MKLEIGDICLSKPPKQSISLKQNILGRIITALTVSPYSHTFVIFEPKEPIVIYDIGTTTKLVSLDNYDNIEYDVYRLRENLTEAEKLRVQEWCMSHLEIKYDYLQLFSFLDKFIFKVKYLFNMPNRYTCSEAVDRLYWNTLGVDLLPTIKEGEGTPGDLSKSLLLYKVN